MRTLEEYITFLMRRFYTFILIFTLISNVNKAQNNKIYNGRIATLQVVAGSNWMSLPIIKLHGDEVINIDFDDLTHQYTRFTYKIEHCEADWTVSEELFPSDYLEGFANGNTIDDCEESINTNTLYSHYSLKIPNSRCSLKMSGNYKVTVYDENNENEPVLSACFMVVEQLMNVRMDIHTNTDIDINNRHQQVDMQLSYGAAKVTDYEQQIRTIVMQNGRTDNARINIKPQYVMADGLRWQHNKDLIFKAGNEYHKYEILDVDHPTMGIENITWSDNNYHVFPFIDEIRMNYVYDEDADGAFYIRNSDNIENDRTCEYVYVHYRLKCPYIKDSRIFINGTWTNNEYSDKYEMLYNYDKGMYEAAIFQKQGYYNYQYMTMDSKGELQALSYDGNFYQTENRYQVLVYFRGQGERSDRLVGYKELKINER